MKRAAFFSSLVRRNNFHHGVRQLSNLGGPKVAVVGAGPAGFYAAQIIAKNQPDSVIDIYERLPVPFGLVRFGVAPDHQDVKKCITTFTKTAELPNVNFIGNTALGRDISLEDLRRCYDSVLLTYGAEEDRELGVPGEHLKNVTAARNIVSMYNGLPGYQDQELNLDTETAVVVGMGNVAIDVARMLLTPIDTLRKFDTTECWLERRRHSRVKRVVLVGRRGPLNVSFTIKELREMTKLEGTRPIFHKQQYIPIKDMVATMERPKKRLMELLVKTALGPVDPKTAAGWAEAQNEWELKLLRSPVEFLAGSDGKSVHQIKLAVNVQKGDSVEQTDETEVIETGLVLRSIGYKSIQAEQGLPFDPKRGVVPNTDGRVESGLYAAGWLGTGPRGVIIDTMNTAFKVGGKIVEDLSTIKDSKKPGLSGMPELMHRTNWEDWLKIDKAETAAGELNGRPREKMTSLPQMLDTITK